LCLYAPMWAERASAMRYLDFGTGLGPRGVVFRAFAGVIALTALIILSEGCFGGGGGGGSSVSGVAPTVGSLCMTGDSSYRVDLPNLQDEVELSVNPFESGYQGSIGGQIRGLSVMTVAIPDAETSELLLWGSGASIKYGTLEKVYGSVQLKRPGAVGDLASVLYGQKRLLIYGTEKGLGIAGPASSGTSLVDYSSSGAWRSVPQGVSSLDISEDASTIFFTTGDGYLQQISIEDLIDGESCSGIVSSEGLPGSSSYVPVRTQVGSDRVFVLSKHSSAITSSAPTFEQAYYPLFSSMIADGIYSTVRAYGLSGSSASEVGFATRDDSFNRFDRFIPTDISSDGQNLYVVGLAYDQQSVYDFLAQECADAGESSQLSCMAEAAKDGSMATYEGGTGIYRFIAGFFIYRDMDDLSKADHFKEIQITALRHQESAPPYLYAIDVKDDTGFVRGPNFLAAISRGETEGGSETWTVSSVADADEGLTAGIPNRIVGYQGGAAASFTAIRAADGAGASELEVMGSDGSFGVLDTGAIYVRVDGAGASTGLVAAIEMASSDGGALYLENAVTKKSIDPSYTNSYASAAAYDGTTLAYAWSSTGTTAHPEYTQKWRVWVQKGSDSSTRGEMFFDRSGGTDGEFNGFPSVSVSDDKPSLKRSIGDIAIADSGDAIAVMYRGYDSGKWYHQVGLYGLTKSGSKYNSPAFLGITGTTSTSASGTAHRGKILSVRKSGSSYEVVYTTPKVIYKWAGPSGSKSSIFENSKLVDAAVDAQSGTRVAIVYGFTVAVKKLSDPAGQGWRASIAPKDGTSLTRLSQASVAMSGNMVAVATPYGAVDTFAVFQLGSSALSPVASTSLSSFLDLEIFDSFPDYILASSPSSGIEIYSKASSSGD